jgi:hypothetical protein
MRPRLLVCFAWIILGWGTVIQINTAYALPVEQTVMKPTSPLIITAYSTWRGGKDIDFVEVYNDSSQPLLLEDWAIHDATNSRDLTIRRHSSGSYIEPKRHALVTYSDLFDTYAYEIEGWSHSVETEQKITKISLLHNDYRPHEVMVDPVKYLDQPMIRSMGVDGYVSSFKNEIYRSFFNDPLYSAPAWPDYLEITEVFASAKGECSPLENQVTCGDYVKLHNKGQTEIVLDNLVLRSDSYSSTRTDSNTILLGGVLAAGGYKAVYLTDSDRRLSLNNGGYVWLEDKWETGPVYSPSLTYYASADTLRLGLAYSHDMGEWGWAEPNPFGTSKLVPLEMTIEECPVGKYRNPETGRCRAIEEAVNSLALCAEGEERNPATNRCRKVVAKTSTLLPCGEGQERNPTTNRCRSIASAIVELLPCDEGYERNPTTNRCRKMQTLTIPKADFPIEGLPTSKGTAAVWGAAGIVTSLLLVYAGWEWRYELAGFAKRLLHKGA